MIPLFIMTALAGGAGHGSYLPMLIFFPALAISVTFPALGPAFGLLAMLQYPIYGAIMCIAEVKGVRDRALLVIGVIHVALVIVGGLAGAGR